jgi:hypothetical protein
MCHETTIVRVCTVKKKVSDISVSSRDRNAVNSFLQCVLVHGAYTEVTEQVERAKETERYSRSRKMTKHGTTSEKVFLEGYLQS